MTDVVNPGESGSLKLPRSVSALRSSKPTPKRVPTRVSILVPEGDSTRNDVSPGARSGTSSDANLATDLQVTSTPWSRKLILTLDGGGIKGYSSLIILRALMKEAAHIEQTLKPAALSSAHTDRIARDAIPDAVYREGQYLPCHYFDYVAGTSFGGLIAIMLGMLGKTVEECTTEFHNQHKAIPLTNDVPGRVSIELPLLRKRNTWPTKRTRSFFDTFAKFSVTSTARSLATAAAASALSSATSSAVAPSEAGSTASTASEFRKDSFQCQTLAWCSEVEEHRERRPYAFCTYKEDDESEKLVSIPEVAKAITTPATSSFKPFKLGSGHFVDGSKQIRDPTLEVLKEITSLLDGGEPVIDLLLSLGTDEHQAWFYEKLRSVVYGNGSSGTSKSSSKSSGGSSRSSADISKEEGRSYHQYHRFEVTDVKLGMRKKNYLSHIEETTEKWLESAEQKAYLRRYAEMLVKRRRARANTARWETFALGVRYHCFHEECSKNHNDRLFDSRGDFYDHLDRRHDLVRLASKNMVDVEQELDKGRQFGLS